MLPLYAPTEDPKHVAPYECRSCRKLVELRPCQICVARDYQRLQQWLRGESVDDDEHEDLA